MTVLWSKIHGNYSGFEIVRYKSNLAYFEICVVLTFYLSVMIFSARLEPKNVTILDVIEGWPEPVKCKTSSGRPSSTIRWFKMLHDTKVTLPDTAQIEIVPLNDSFVETKT